jgi:hypothetical protein
MEVFYHASPVRGLTILKPFGRHKRHPNDSPRIYVARQPVVAVIFMIDGLNDSWSRSGSWDGRQSWWLVVGDEERFREREQLGGSLYTVPAAGFRHDPDIGLGEAEWYTDSPVPVLHEERWDLALKAMLHYGLNVLFVPKAQFAEFQAHPDQWEVMRQAKKRPDGTFVL